MIRPRYLPSSIVAQLVLASAFSHSLGHKQTWRDRIHYQPSRAIIGIALALNARGVKTARGRDMGGDDGAQRADPGGAAMRLEGLGAAGTSCESG